MSSALIMQVHNSSVPTFTSMEIFKTSGGVTSNPGPVWVTSLLLYNNIDIATNQTFSDTLSIVNGTTRNPFNLNCLGVSGATV